MPKRKPKDKEDWMRAFPFLFESDPYGLKAKHLKRKRKVK
jgi:hypothetical protein